MKKFNKPDIKIIEQLAQELAIEPSFIEKDWYATRVLEVLKYLSDKEIKFVFAGGTCLSKAYGLIERFSEDIDFKITRSANIDRNARRAIRENIAAALEKAGIFKIIKVVSENESRKITIEIDYLRFFKTPSSLRAHIKAEFVFENTLLEAEQKPISTFYAKYAKDSGGEFSLYCVAPLETAAEKLSALLWRVIMTDRTAKLYSIKNDPTLMRHLYDLFALKDFVFKNPSGFVRLSEQLYEKDKKRDEKNKTKTFKQAVLDAVKRLEEDKAFEEDYKKFVQAMSYAKDEKQISFALALKNFKHISKSLL